MGFLDSLFGGGEETRVGTNIQRAVPDAAIISSVTSGSIKALFDHGEIADYVLEEMITSIGMQAERMYNYAQNNYPYGLPAGASFQSSSGDTAVAAVIGAIEDAAVTIEYSHYAPPNSLHIGWMSLVAEHGYNPDSNTLVVDAETVWLDDMVVVVPTALLDQYSPGALAQWGPAACGGYTPLRPGYINGLGRLVSPSPFHTEAGIDEDYLRISYVRADGSTGSFTLPVQDFDNTADYFHVRYKVGSTTKFWMYRDGAGTYPTLDAVFAMPATNGTFFPFMHFRHGKVPLHTDKSSAGYKTTARMLKYLGLQFDAVQDAINENPNVNDIEQATLMMAVPATTANEIERRYLFDFFNNLYNAVGNAATSTRQNSIAGDLYNNGNESYRYSAMAIEDSLFKMTLSNNGIIKSRKVGQVAAVETHSSSYTETEFTSEFIAEAEDGSTAIYTQTFPARAHVYQRQVSEHLYDEIIVGDLTMMYHVYGQYTVTGDETDAILLIPLDRTVTDAYSILDREELYRRSLHFVFNSRTVTYVKWYQTGLFQIFLIAVAIAVTIVSSGATWESIAAAMTAATATTAAFMTFVVTSLMKYVVFTAAAKLFVKLVGPEAATIVAVVAAAAGLYQINQAGNAKALAQSWAKELIAVSTNLSQAITGQLQQDLLADTQILQQQMAEQTKTLETAQELLEGNSRLAPFIMFGETPNDFFNRTIHAGNIGQIAVDDIHNYVSRSLELPKFRETALWLP